MTVSSVAYCSTTVYSATTIGGTLSAWTTDYGYTAGTTGYMSVIRYYKDVVPGEYFLYQSSSGGANNVNQAWGILSYDPKPFANYMSIVA